MRLWILIVLFSFSGPASAAYIDAMDEMSPLRNTKGNGSLASFVELNRALAFLRDKLKEQPTGTRIRSVLSATYGIRSSKYLKDKKNLEDSLKDLHMALYICPHSLSARRQLDLTLRNGGKDPNNIEERIQFAKGYFEKGNYIDALVEYRQILKIRDDDEIRKALNEAINKRNKDPRYMVEFDMKPNYLGPGFDELLEEASTYIKNGHVAHAASKLDTASSLDPNNPRLKELEIAMLAAFATKQPFGLATTTSPDLDSYSKQTTSIIRKRWMEHPKKDFPRGFAKVSFRIHQDGTISDVLLIRKSGSFIYDDWCIRSVSESKLPPLPEDFIQESLTGEISF